MNSFHGIPISEHIVLLYSITFSIFFLISIVLIGVCVWLLTVTWKSVNKPKETQRIRNLKEKAQNDEIAKKQLEKIKRQRKWRKERNKADLISQAFLLCLAVGLSIFLQFEAMAGWKDYINKDYAVYTGEITVHQRLSRRSFITLDDGTVVWGIDDFDAEDTYGTVVYSRKSKQFLGGQK